MSPDDGLLRKWLDPFARARDFSGIVAIEQAGRAPSIFATGEADFGNAAPLSRSSVFGVESVSKLFTIEALKSLAADDRLSLDDPLARWLPEYPDARAITIRLIAQHRGGLARDLQDFQDRWPFAHDLPALVAACAAVPPIAAPGTRESYSNNGYRLLARVIELADNAPFDEVVQQRVLRPRAMSSTREWTLSDVVPELASGHVPGARWESLRRPPPCDMTNFRGAASYCSTVDDLLKFARSTRPPASGEQKPRASAGHDGRGHGFVSMCYRYPLEQTSIVVVGNIESGLFDSLKAGLERIVFEQQPPTLGPPSVSASSANLADLIGDYDLFGSKLTIRGDTVSGYFIDGGDGPQALTAINEREAFFRLRYARLELVDAADGPQLRWTEPSGGFNLRKLR